MSLIERIYARVKYDDAGCHLWQGAKTSAGYGLISVQNVRQYVHRLTYEIIKGSIEPPLTIDHLCRVRHCCNPDHLEAVPIGVNVLRGNAFTAINARKTIFACGHPIDAEHTGYASRGDRYCKVCNRAKVRAYYAQRRTAK